MTEKSREELFRALESKKLIKPTGQVPSDVIYTPPQGKIIEDKQANQELLEYVPTDPTAQTDLLQSCERQFVLPMVMPLAFVFRVPPITDDVYRFATDEMKDSSLFCIISRSNIKKLDNGFIMWSPFVVVIKRKIVVQLNAAYHPTQKLFKVVSLHLWQNSAGSYYRIRDDRLTQTVLPGIIDRYVTMEGIFKTTGEQ